MKNKRQEKILQIISMYDIETQEDLIEKLKEAGMDVTQATVSRDIRELKIVKITTEDHRFKYAKAIRDDIQISAKYRNIIKETIIKVDYANNFVVLRSYAGMANATAAAVDGMKWSEIVGTLAGDDTVFVLMRDNEAAIDFVNNIKEITESKN